MLPYLQAAYVLAYNHTVGRLRAAYKVATFPLLTNRAREVKFWAACGRLAWQGLCSPNPRALDHLVKVRERVEQMGEADAAAAMKRAYEPGSQP